MYTEGSIAKINRIVKNIEKNTDDMQVELKELSNSFSNMSSAASRMITLAEEAKAVLAKRQQLQEREVFIMRKVLAVISATMMIATLILSVAVFKVDATSPLHFTLYKGLLLSSCGFIFPISALFSEVDEFIEKRRAV